MNVLIMRVLFAIVGSFVLFNSSVRCCSSEEIHVLVCKAIMVKTEVCGGKAFGTSVVQA